VRRTGFWAIHHLLTHSSELSDYNFMIAHFREHKYILLSLNLDTLNNWKIKKLDFVILNMRQRMEFCMFVEEDYTYSLKNYDNAKQDFF
jgi:hypothetical protein